MAETLLPYSVPTRSAPAAFTKTELARMAVVEKEKEKEGGEEEGKEGGGRGTLMKKYRGRGRLLEIYGQPGEIRRGWTMLVQQSAAVQG